jgi:maltose O-acetyltransferase
VPNIGRRHAHRCSCGLFNQSVLDANAVTIGERCSLGPQVMPAASSHELGPPEQRAGKRTTGAVRIGDGCWIGVRVVVVLPDTVIGSGVVVAAGSGLLEPNGLYAGVPAIRKRELPTGG